MTMYVESRGEKPVIPSYIRLQDYNPINGSKWEDKGGLYLIAARQGTSIYLDTE